MFTCRPKPVEHHCRCRAVPRPSVLTQALCISAIAPLRTTYECWWPVGKLIAQTASRRRRSCPRDGEVNSGSAINCRGRSVTCLLCGRSSICRGLMISEQVSQSPRTGHSAGCPLSAGSRLFLLQIWRITDVIRCLAERLRITSFSLISRLKTQNGQPHRDWPYPSGICVRILGHCKGYHRRHIWFALSISSENQTAIDR